MSFRLYTFGGLRLEADGEAVTGPASQRRRLGLLALLAAHGERGLKRDKAFGYLWPEHDTARARHLLSESLYVIRRAIGDEVVQASGDDVRLNHDLLWSDVAAYRQALAHDPESAVPLYTGAFLDGFFLPESEDFDQWASGERDALAREHGRALERIAGEHAARNDHVAAADWLRRLTQHDPYSSRVALAYMQALVNAGDRAAAVRHAGAHTSLLREQLGIEPDAEVLRFAESAPRAGGAAPRTSGSPLDDLAPEFEIVRELGAGSVATVYLAREIALRRQVAIKVLRPEHVQFEVARLRFEREAQSAARIHHPNVASPFRFGRLSSGAPYLILPYISGGSLEDRLAASGRIPFVEAKRQVAQLASALAAAHRLGIVHRDVRPGNVLYDRDADRVLLTDFGLAAVLDAEASLRLTRPGESLGDVAYASPEQLRGEPVTERADVYSLGITAFMMMAGRLPFDARKPGELLMAHATATPRLLREFVPDADEKTEALLRRCMNKRPEQRPFAEELG